MSKSQVILESLEAAMCDAVRSGNGIFKVHYVPSIEVFQPAPPKPYGCHNRAPIVTVCKPTCQYTHSNLGQADARCHGCRERSNG